MRTQGCQDLNLTVNPPPDLAIEVISTRNAAAAMMVQAWPGVPEAWADFTRDHSIRIERRVVWEYEGVDRDRRGAGWT